MEPQLVFYSESIRDYTDQDMCHRFQQRKKGLFSWKEKLKRKTTNLNGLLCVFSSLGEVSAIRCPSIEQKFSGEPSLKVLAY